METPTLPAADAGGAVAAAGAPTAAAGSSGPGSPRSAPSSPSDGGASIASSARTAQASDTAEDAACVALLRAAHRAFPLAEIELMSTSLLRSSVGGRTLTRRVFVPEDELKAPFLSAREAFRVATSDAEWPAPPEAPGIAVALGPPHGRRGGEYLGAAYASLEFDFILKVPSPAEASREWAGVGGNAFGDAGNAQLFLLSADQERSVDVDLAPPAALAPAAAAAAAAETATGMAPAAKPHRRSFTDQFYAKGACLYIVGEVYAPLPTSSGYKLSAAKKLVQAERLLQFLRAKENVPNVCDCVLGFVFMGPHMDESMGATLLHTLRHYRRVLPCVWALHRESRLFGLNVTAISASVAAALNGFALADVQVTLASMQANMTSMQADMTSMKADMTSMKADISDIRRFIMDQVAR